MNDLKLGPILIGVIIAVLIIVSAPLLWETGDAKNITVIQSMNGTLNVYTEPGIYWQGFGKVTTYPRREQFSFSAEKDQGSNEDQSITTRFNDGGHGQISGTMNWQMPLATDKVIALHKDFGSYEAIEQQLIRPSMQKVIYNVGPTMSSTESSAEKRPEIPKYIDDQLLNGPYQTKTIQVTQKDAISGQDKQVATVQIALDSEGKAVRESISQITKYGIAIQPVAINSIKYDGAVENQIKQRQIATTQVQISIANAKKAEQDAITIAEQGKAKAAEAKWAQETINAKEIAEAEKTKEVAGLAAQTAQLYKQRLILEGEGEATKKRLIMEADGALEPKLKAAIEINARYAEAIEKAQPGAWVPNIQMSNSTNNGGSSATNLIDLMTAKTAKDLSLDLTITQGTKAKK